MGMVEFRNRTIPASQIRNPKYRIGPSTLRFRISDLRCRNRPISKFPPFPSDSMENAVSRLNQLDSCAVSDAMDKLGLRGVVTGIHQFSTQRKIAGRVLTVKLGIDDR